MVAGSVAPHWAPKMVPASPAPCIAMDFEPIRVINETHFVVSTRRDRSERELFAAGFPLARRDRSVRGILAPDFALVSEAWILVSGRVASGHSRSAGLVATEWRNIPFLTFSAASFAAIPIRSE